MSHMFILASTQLERMRMKIMIGYISAENCSLKKKSSSLNNAQFVNTQFYLIVFLVISHDQENLRDCRINHPGDSETNIEDSGIVRFEFC